MKDETCESAGGTEETDLHERMEPIGGNVGQQRAVKRHIGYLVMRCQKVPVHEMRKMRKSGVCSKKEEQKESETNARRIGVVVGVP